MINSHEREVERLHRVLAPLYEEGGYNKRGIAELWIRIEKEQKLANLEEVRRDGVV